MTDYSISPYGQGATMPDGYPIADNLTTDSAQQALSAAQGVVLKGMIDAKADGDTTIARYSVNLCKGVESGKELNSSGAVTSGTGLVTDYIPIIVGDGTHNWEKTEYLHVCASVFKSSAFGYRAAKVCTYNSSKTYIGTISSVSAVIDKESNANSTTFTNAAFVRVQFASGTSDHYVALSNKPVLPEYSPYDKSALSASADAVFPKFRNTDGAINNMLVTALDYLNNTSTLNLGYGDSATAFDETVEAVTCDPWNTGAYTGEKKQINCSTFVQLCLCGIRYGNSRYVLGSSADNIGVNGYVFDDKVETNYHNARESDTAAWSGYSFARFVPCSSHNKLYANRLLKYAYDRGFAYIIEDGFKNVEAGDVLFVSNSSGVFKDIGHTLFVSTVSLKDDGTKTITTLEDVETGVKAETVSSRTATWVYGARFPLPKIASRAKNIVSSVTKESHSALSSGGTAVIGTLSLSENVKAKGVYTVVVKCSSVGNFEVRVGTLSGSTFTALSTNGESLARRGDGVTVKHFILPVNSTVDTSTLAVQIKAYGGVSANAVEIVEAKVYNEYITE